MFHDQKPARLQKSNRFFDQGVRHVQAVFSASPQGGGGVGENLRRQFAARGHVRGVRDDDVEFSARAAGFEGVGFARAGIFAHVRFARAGEFQRVSEDEFDGVAVGGVVFTRHLKSLGRGIDADDRGPRDLRRHGEGDGARSCAQVEDARPLAPIGDPPSLVDGVLRNGLGFGSDYEGARAADELKPAKVHAPGDVLERLAGGSARDGPRKRRALVRRRVGVRQAAYADREFGKLAGVRRRGGHSGVAQKRGRLRNQAIPTSPRHSWEAIRSASSISRAESTRGPRSPARTWSRL